MRPATFAGATTFSSSSLERSPKPRCRSAAKCSRRKSLGYAIPPPGGPPGGPRRKVRNFSRRSSISLLSSCCSMFLDSLLQARADEIVQVAVEHRLGGAFLHPGAQVLDARLVEHVRADLVSPLDVGLLRGELSASALRLRSSSS